MSNTDLTFDLWWKKKKKKNNVHKPHITFYVYTKFHENIFSTFCVIAVLSVFLIFSNGDLTFDLWWKIKCCA